MNSTTAPLTSAQRTWVAVLAPAITLLAIVLLGTLA